MRAAWAQVSGVLLLVSVLLGAALADGALTEPSLLLGAVGALFLVWGAAGSVVSPTPSVGPAVAARARRRALARRAVPRQRDPDASGHTRARAPSDLLPAA